MKLSLLLEDTTKVLKHSGGCHSCPRKKKKYVPAALREAQVIIVGTAPSPQEVILGEALTDKTGVFLRKALAEVGVKGYAVTTTIHCSPDDDPADKEISCCMNQFVIQEVTGYPYVLLVGNVAAKAFFPSENVTHLRGNVTWHPDFPGQRFFTIADPGYVMDNENPNIEVTFRQHLERFSRVVHGEPDKFKVVQGGSEEFFDALRYAVRQRALGYDIETNRLESWEPDAKIRSLSIAPDTSQAIFAHCDEPWWNEVLGEVTGFLGNPRSVVIGHNLGFDLTWTESQTGKPVRANGIYDTQVLFYHARGYQMVSLKELQARHGDGYRYLVTAPHKCKDMWLMSRYNSEDVIHPLSLVKLGLTMLQPKQFDLFSRVAGPSSLALRRLTHNGVYYRLDHMAKIEAQLEEEKRQLLEKWQAEDPKFIPNIHRSDKGFADYALRIKGLQALAVTKTGRAQLDEYCLKEWVRQGHTWVQHELDIRKIDKKQSTYVGGYRKWVWSDGCIHPDYHNDSVDSGRTSARSPSYQNVIRESLIRSNYGTRKKGNLFVQGDFSQIELRIAMCLARDPVGIQAYRDGKDLHASTAEAMAGPQYTKQDRSNAKPVNFSLIYGGSWEGLQEYAKNEYGVFFTDEEAQRYVRTFFATYKNLQVWHQECNERLRANKGWGEQIVGHRFLYKDWNNPDQKVRDHAFRAHTNAMCQGPAAYMLLLTLIEAQREIIDRGHSDILTIGEVHDSIHADLPEELLPEYLDIMQVALNRTYDWVKDWFVVPLVMDFEAGPSWGEAKELPNKAIAYAA